MLHDLICPIDDVKLQHISLLKSAIDSANPNHSLWIKRMIIRCIALACWIMLTLEGCNSLGSNNILVERAQYNDAIQYTNSEQTLMNIVRIANGENPAFLGPAEITDNSTLAGSANGGSSTIAGPSAIGMLTSMVSYTKQPVVRYTVANGSDLVQQYITPIKLIDIFNLSNSNAPVTPLFVLSFNDLTPNFSDYFKSISIINALDTIGAAKLELEADDVLAIRFRPNGIIARPNERIVQDKSISCYGTSSEDRLALKLWDELRSIYRQPYSDRIFLHYANSYKKTAAVSPRTAQGSLGVSRNEHDIKFGSPDQISSIISQNLRAGKCQQDFYFIGEEKSPEELWSEYYIAIANGGTQGSTFRTYGRERALILIQTSKYPVENAFVSTYKDGYWYSIRNDDKISKTNFSLLSTIAIVSARSAPSSPTLTAITLR